MRLNFSISCILVFLIPFFSGCSTSDIDQSDFYSYVKLLGDSKENQGVDFIQTAQEDFVFLLYSKTSSGNDYYLSSMDVHGNIISYKNLDINPFPVLTNIFYSADEKIYLFGTAYDYVSDKFILAEVDKSGTILSNQIISDPVLDSLQPDKLHLISVKSINNGQAIGVLYGFNDEEKEKLFTWQVGIDITDIYLCKVDFYGKILENCRITDLPDQLSSINDFIYNNNYMYFTQGTEDTKVNIGHEMNCNAGSTRHYLENPNYTVQNVTYYNNQFFTVQAFLQEDIGGNNSIRLIKLKNDLSESWSLDLNNHFKSGILSVDEEGEIMILYNKKEVAEKFVFEIYESDGNLKYLWSLEDLFGPQKAHQVVKTQNKDYAILVDIEFDGNNRAALIVLNQNGEIVN